MVSCLRAMTRSTLMPQTVRPGLKEIVLNGILSSALQPSSRIRASGFPDAVPVEAGLARVGEPFAAGAERVDEKDVSGPLVLERVEQDPDDVVARPLRRMPVVLAFLGAAAVVGHVVGRDASGLAVAAQDPDVQARVVVEDPELGRFRRVLARPRIRLPEAGEGLGRAPDGVGDETVDLRPLRNADGLQSLRAKAGDEDGQDEQARERGTEHLRHNSSSILAARTRFCKCQFLSENSRNGVPAFVPGVRGLTAARTGLYSPFSAESVSIRKRGCP